MRATKWSVLLLATLVAIMVYATAVMAAQPPQCSVNASISGPSNNNQPETTNGSPTLVTLNGTPSKQNATSMSWEQISGPSVTFSFDFDNSTGLPVKASFFAPSVGPDGAILAFRLTVSGCTPTLYSSTTSTVNITNVNQNQAPTASAVVLVNDVPADIANEGDSVALNGTASSDPDGNTLIFTWSQIAGAPTVTLANSDTAVATFTAPVVPFPDGASLTFRLNVSDGTLSNSTDKIVTIHWVNDPPIASLQCPASVNEGEPVMLDGSLSSDNDGDGIASYAWVQTQAAPVADLSGCLSSSSTCSFTAPQLGPQYNTMSFRLTVTDNGGLSNAAECSVIVLDVTPPAITVPADITAEATSASGAIVDFSVSATDLVDGSVLVSCSTPTSGNMFALGDTTVTCSASDKAGNTASASFSVKVQDTTPPSLTLPTPITKEATGPSGATVTFSVTANDLVDGPVTPVCAPTSGSTFALGTTSVTCSATDAHGNTASGSFSVNVVDTTPPALILPANKTVEATGPAGAAVTFAASATDIVDGSVAVTCIPASGSIFSLGTTTVNCSATDAHFNTGSGSFTVTVVDTTPPSLKLPSNITTDASSLSGAVVTYTASADDLVDGSVTPVCTPASRSTFAPGSTEVNCSATDSHNNRSSGSFIVTVTFRLSGFYSPIDMNGVTNTVKGGSTVPMKFEVFAGATELTSTSAILSIKTQQISCTFVSGAEDPLPTDALATGGTSLRYDSTGGQFIYNWQTPKSAGACFVVTMTALDGSHLSANFKLK